LQSLNEALDQAVGAALRAEARLAAVKAALARGEPVLPPGEARNLSELQGEAAALRREIAEFKRRYQPQMATMHPRMQALPGQLERVETAIRQRLEQGGQNALHAAEQAAATSREEVQGLRERVTPLRREVAEFNARSAQHAAMARDLEDLERLQREFEARQAEAAAEPAEFAPEVQLVQAAVRPEWPLWPDYRRDSGIAVGASLAAALLAAAIGRLRGRVRPVPESPTRSGAEQMLLSRQQRLAAARGGEGVASPTPGADEPEPRELTEPELRRLADAAGPDGRQVLGLVLSGLSLREAAALKPAGVDRVAGRLRGSDPPRDLPLSPRLDAWLAAVEPCPAWAEEAGVEPAELDALLRAAAANAGLERPETVNAAALRHTCILHLMRAGLRPGELEAVVGRIPAPALARYARCSAARPALPAQPAAWAHPFLARSPAP
jgi:integrase